MRYMCPVCGYPNLEAKPVNHEICPSCGTQFGYDDYLRPHAELRQEWLDNGAEWFLKGYEPYKWNAYTQLQNAGFIKVESAPTANTTQVAVDLNIPSFSSLESDGIRVIVGQASQDIGIIG